MPTPEIRLSLTDSTPAPASSPYRSDAPNVVVIVLDDAGFAQLGCYGSDIDTPNIDRLADRGVRFTNFHTTAICSPTRACLLTGRSHHRVGMGMLPDMPINYPGYTGCFPAGAGTLAEVLRAQGYTTTAIGKWHLVPRDQRAVGPYDMWPTGVGFDRYYGFLNGTTNQWTPNLVRDQQHVEPPRRPEEGYHLEADLADEAIAQLRELHQHNPARPFLLWYATAAPHAPHQAPAEWIDRYRGRFDGGWDVWRTETFARQKAMGIVPDDAVLSERPDWVEPWAEVDADRRRLYSRMMEVYAAFLSYCDHQIGRVLDAIDDLGRGDDTIVVLVSDNGASAEGGPHGTWNHLRHVTTDETDEVEDSLAHLDDLGGFNSNGHMPWGWAWAGNTPFRRWKRYTFEGGVRDPMIVSWPAGIDSVGTVRHQYVHVTDVPLTIMDLAGIEAPSHLDGVEQLCYDGVSFAAPLADPEAGEVRTSQYYECWGSRAIYADGWKAVTNHVNQLTASERDRLTGSFDFADDEWLLFHTVQDFSEVTDLADREPEKLAELTALWDVEAECNQVLPLSDDRTSRIAQMHTPWLQYRGDYDLAPGDKIHEVHSPVLFGGFRMTAHFSQPFVGDEHGVLCEQGNHLAGWAWLLDGGSTTWVLASDGTEHRLTIDVPAGARFITVDGIAVDGAFDITIHTAEGVDPATMTLPGGMPMLFSADGAFLTVGYGRPFPVCADYEPPCPAPQTFARLRVQSGPPPPFNFAATLADAMAHQ